MKFPAVIPKRSKIWITQYFTYDPIKNPLGHSGIDFVPYDAKRSPVDNQFIAFGSIFAMDRDVKCVATDYSTPLNETGNGVRVEYQEGEWFYQVLFWHSVVNTVKVGDIVKAGQEIGRMGNAGFVQPTVTTDNPLNGTHCHLSLQRMKRTQWGNTEVVFLNPLDYFDVTNPVGYTDEVISKEDGEPLKWAFEKLGLKTAYEKLLYILRFLDLIE